MTQMLQPYGVEVQAVALAQQALEIFGQWQPDAIVSEIALPKEDGFALIRKVRTLKQRGKTVLAIAVTAYATEKIRQRALCAGFDLWFAKPLHFDEFVAVLTCLAVCQQSSTRSGMSWKWQSNALKSSELEHFQIGITIFETPST